jgi:hypothetical protein
LLFHCATRKYRTALAGGAATVLAAIAISAPASAAETTPTATSWSWGAGAVVPDSPDRLNIPDNVLPAVQDSALNFTRPGG